MNLRPSPSSASAFTATELAVVIVLLVTGSLYLFALAPLKHQGRGRMKCASNLKQISLAYKVFANDNDDKFPFLVTNSLAYGNLTQTWLHFQAMSNELGSAMVLVCWSERDRLHNVAADFGMGATATKNSLSTKSNAAVSYSASLDADPALPNVILSSDRYLVTNAHVLNGSLFLANSNTTRAAWTPDFHGGAGNLVLSDGSVHQLTTHALMAQIKQQGRLTNRLLLPLLP